MDLRKVKKLIELVQESGITELEVRTGDEQVRISRASNPVDGATALAPNPQPSEKPPRASGPGTIVAAPLAGTFYRSPAPGEAPFVEVGDTVAVGDVLCIVESMKMMNHVESECAGEVAEVLVANGKPIESGTALFRIL
ncbi:MAG: acetyl-CoA carboxylase biotin carboxyl carrier protein [Gammaproteobacteria bacterium]|nr:acetyl-CoA carboxylase biotin carboxyl carrier protein [Gammaproteobacteria bacterium]